MHEVDSYEGSLGNIGDWEIELFEDDQRAWESILTKGIEGELGQSDPVRKNCKYVVFLSFSKGRGRKRKHPVEVELVRYEGKCHLIIPGYLGNGIDGIATEVYGDTVHPAEAASRLLEDLRKRK